MNRVEYSQTTVRFIDVAQTKQPTFSPKELRWTDCFCHPLIPKRSSNGNLPPIQAIASLSVRNIVCEGLLELDGCCF